MVIKITQAKGSRGLVTYNDKKVKAGEGSILGYNKIATDGQDIALIPAGNLAAQLEMRAALNAGNGKKFIHISINPNPDEKLTDAKLVAVTKDYMKQMGYASQPYIIYKHTDIDREHVHVVASSIKENGSLVNDSNLFRRSNQVRKELEEKHNLLKGSSRQVRSEGASMAAMDYRKSFSSGQIKSIGLGVLNRVKFRAFGDYAAYLETLGVAVRQTTTLDGTVLGLTYQPLEDGQLQGLPVKASRIEPGGRLGMESLEKGFSKNKALLESRLGEFEDRLVQGMVGVGSNKSVAGLQKQSIQPVFADNQVLGFVDTKQGHFYSVEQLSPYLKASVSSLRAPQKSENKNELPKRKHSVANNAGVATNSAIGDFKEGSLREGNNPSRDVLGDIGRALGQTGAEGPSSDNDKALKRNTRKKGI